MFHNKKRHHTQEKSKKHYIKKSSTHIVQSIAERSKSKHKKSSKLQNNRKHSRFKHIRDGTSDYVGPERLTNHVGFFTKGKISDSISRLEKTMPTEIKARVQQDLKQVLNLSNTEHKRYRNKYSMKHKSNSKVQSVHSSIVTPLYLLHKTGFASSSWKNKLQKSVGVPSVNSILASVHEQPQKESPIQSEQLIAREALLKKIHPCIKEVNSFMFPNKSNKDKVKDKLLQIKNQLKPPSEPDTVCSSLFKSPQISPNSNIKNSSQNGVDKDFELNPIFTGESINNSDFSKIFPPADNFAEYSDDLMSENESSYLPNSTYENEVKSSREISSSLGAGSDSVALVPSSPTTSENSPSWKLQLSPVKFVPENPPTPTIYFRHKMF